MQSLSGFICVVVIIIFILFFYFTFTDAVFVYTLPSVIIFHCGCLGYSSTVATADM